MRFTVQHRDPNSRARTGLIETAHGTFRTPAFMPVASKGAVKTIPPRDLREIGVEIVLSNLYHLALRPGIETVEAAGGLHRFMGWNGPLLTDSGGYQVFSLARLRTIRFEGVEFQSHLDGSTILLTPEDVVRKQERMGVDIAMPLDQPVPNPSAHEEAEEALARTNQWLERSMKARTVPEATALFGIVQGALHYDLRRRSVEKILEFDPPGIAVGGLMLGESNPEMHELAAYTASILPDDRPRYLMGVGTPEDIRRAVIAGYDLFDCVLPTRMARTGRAYTSEGMVRLRHGRYAKDVAPLDPACGCLACKNFSRAYLRHCLNVDEIIGITMISWHNLWHYMRLMEGLRASIEAGTISPPPEAA